MAYPGTIFIISAPSGAGKTSLVRALLQDLPNIKKSISYTTRKERALEKNGIDYHFISHDEFNKMLDQHLFLESAQVFNNFYGTSKIWVEEQINQGEDIILEIDWQGARQLRAKYFNTVSIYILPPSEQELRARLNKRHQDNQTIIEDRMKQAKHEASKYVEYDYLVLNDNFDKALIDLKNIILSHRCALLRQQEILKDILFNLFK